MLLKNQGVLPLDRAKLRKIAIIGVNARERLNGNYEGSPTNHVNLFDGIQKAAGAGISVEWRRGSPLAENPNPPPGTKVPGYQQVNADDLAQAVDLAKGSDVVIYVGGLNTQLEGEESRIELPGFSHGDRTVIELPEAQDRLLKALQATGKPVIFVNCSGSAIAMPWEVENLPAIVQAWYPGGEGGTGVAEVLFGDYNPAGRLPVTFYAKTADLPEFTDYRMADRTYRYFTGKPLFPFGYGLSYTTFQYQTPTLANAKLGAKDTVKLRVPVKNTGKRDGDEVVQVYLRHGKSPVPQPIHSLVAYKRMNVAKGATASFDFEIPVERFHYWSETKNDYVVDPGDYELEVGASSGDIQAHVRVSVTGS